MSDDAIFAAIDNVALRKRGTLRAWMVRNQAAFAAKLETIRPDWTALAQVFADAGLLDARGNKPTAEATRKTWQRVRGPVRGKAKPAQIETASPPPVTSAPMMMDRPRERRPIILRPPKALAEGEPAPDDGSRLPAPLRPDRK